MLHSPGEEYKLVELVGAERHPQIATIELAEETLCKVLDLKPEHGCEWGTQLHGCVPHVYLGFGTYWPERRRGAGPMLVVAWLEEDAGDGGLVSVIDIKEELPVSTGCLSIDQPPPARPALAAARPGQLVPR